MIKKNSPAIVLFVLLSAVLGLMPTIAMGEGGINSPPSAQMQSLNSTIPGGTLPEFNFDGGPTFPTAAQTVGTFTFTIPTGKAISDISISGQFGNSVVGSSAPVDIFLDGLLVATCLDSGECCNITTPWSNTVASDDFPLDEKPLSRRWLIRRRLCIQRNIRLPPGPDLLSSRAVAIEGCSCMPGALDIRPGEGLQDSGTTRFSPHPLPRESPVHKPAGDEPFSG